MIKAVLFDVDGVLVNSADANVKFYQDLFSHFGYPPPEKETLLHLLHLPMMDVIKTVTKQTELKEIQKIWLAGKDRTVPYPHSLIKIPDYLNETIKSLSTLYILGVVTSRVEGGVYEVPQLAHLEKYFKTTVYYENTEKHKPDPEPLLLASHRLSILPKEIAYVGDMKSDMKAADAAGMKAILFKENNNCDAEYWTSSFKELPHIISCL
ncbi:HAD-IA family hydrolase [Candidatus Roizmanbacteria bacterium]|nr:HAD-IA family hydrolase [Candidatus Roizmanbacteria bacterium]